MNKLKNGDRLSLLIWYKNEEDEACVYSGLIQYKEDRINLINEKTGIVRTEIFKEWLTHLKKVPDDLSEILLDADYYIPLLMKDIPENIANELLINTDMKWIDKKPKN